ncbi:MAG TPA: amidohydrolase family protein [Candidatus Binatia bacterium]|nr:amidohydrolase family protein [Candidatus Binatia bacterium]
MTPIIDIDSHFEPGGDWLEPYPGLAARLPKLDPAILAVDAIVGDFLRDVPDGERPPAAELLPPGLLTLFGNEKLAEADRRKDFEGKSQFQVANAEARVAWLDRQGIAVQNVICLSGFAYNLFLDDPALRREVLHTCDTWLAETCAASGGRLLPVATPDFTELEVAVAELERMRRLGSRIFLIPGHPVGGVSPAHPSWDRVWSAAVSLGMAPMLHVGLQHARFDPGWANVGGDATLLRMIGSSHRHVAPMTLIYSLVYAGAFERFPTLTLLLAEVGTGWLPFVMREIDDRVSPVAELFIGKSSLPLRPSEYLARNVRATPLSGGNDQPLVDIMRELPEEMIVFSSDFPHFEGFTDPMGYYADALNEVSSEHRDRFLGGSMADVFARMKDPVV